MQREKTDLLSVATGNIIAIEKVNDPVFAGKMMGDGFAVEPTDKLVYSPVAGKIVSIFPTKHAIGLQTASGVDVLVHMGLNTVELKEAAFNLHVEEGQTIAAGDLLAEMDLETVKAEGKETTIVVALTNGDKVKSYQLTQEGQQHAKAVIGYFES